MPTVAPKNTRIDKHGKRNCRKCQAHTSLKAHYNKIASLKHRILELENQLEDANKRIVELMGGACAKY
jgi:hypothetical protein